MVNAKNLKFSLQIGMPLANAQNSMGYTDTVMFLTISKPDIYHYKSLFKWAGLPKLFCTRYPT